MPVMLSGYVLDFRWVLLVIWISSNFWGEDFDTTHKISVANSCSTKEENAISGMVLLIVG